MAYDELKRLIEQLGVHEQLGPTGQGWGIEQNPHELATFLASVGDQIGSVLEIGTGYQAGLARLLAERLGMRVTSVDIHSYGHTLKGYPGITFLVSRDRIPASALPTSFDLVIIDGDHAYDSVQADWGHYGPMGKIVMFHDSCILLYFIILYKYITIF